MAREGGVKNWVKTHHVIDGLSCCTINEVTNYMYDLVKFYDTDRFADIDNWHKRDRFRKVKNSDDRWIWKKKK